MSHSMTQEHYTQKDGRRLYEADRSRAFADPEFRAIYKVETRKKERWLRLAEARQARRAASLNNTPRKASSKRSGQWNQSTSANTNLSPSLLWNREPGTT